MILLTSFVLRTTSPWFIWASFGASIVTIVGFITMFTFFYNRWVSKLCQRRIILDMTRHLFVNTAILEGIRIMLRKKNYEVRPSNEVFERFAFLPIDTNLTQFAVTAKNYDIIHEASLYIRNYNITVDTAARHFENPAISAEIREQMLNDIFSRAVRITQRLLMLAQKQRLHIDEKRMVQYLNHNQQTTTQQKGLLSLSYTEADILDREGFDDYNYYDKLGLTDLLNKSIIARCDSVIYIPIQLDTEVENS